MHSFYVGPCAVKNIAQKLSKVGLDVYVGTEHIYVSLPEGGPTATRYEILDLILRNCGHNFGMR